MILYLPSEKELNDRLLRIISTVAGEAGLEVIRLLEELKVRLLNQSRDVAVTVIYVESYIALTEILPLSDRLGAMRVALIFPDEQPDLLEKARLLRPHLILAMEEDFIYLNTTLKRMTELFRMISR